MLMPRLVIWLSAIGMVFLRAGAALGQDYPTKPIRIVTGSVGGGNDFAARLIAPGLASSLGQQLVIENRGGSAIIPAQIVAQAPPDGYTLFFYNNAMWTLPLVQKVPYDPVRDFSPITLVTSSPNILVVHPSLPAKSVKQLIALAKARPGELNYASGGTASSNHLAAELFKAMAGVNIVQISYKGSGAAVIDLLGGNVQLMFPNTAAATPHVKSGRLRALAVTSAAPSELLPDLPTVAASGLPGYESVSLVGLFAPAGTPATVISRLNRETVRVLNRADVKERLSNDGQQVVGSLPEQLAATVKSEIVRLGKVVKDAGIRAD